MYMPYKTSTDRLNPFSGQLGNYTVIMGNTGGDNRIEFGTRLDHVIRVRLADLVGLELRCRLRARSEPRPQQRSDLARIGGLLQAATTRAAATCS